MKNFQKFAHRFVFFRLKMPDYNYKDPLLHPLPVGALQHI